MAGSTRFEGYPTFEGFPPEAIQFLADLAANNDRAWFAARKATYEALLKRPLEALCVALAERFEARGIDLTADPARSPFRIYRDVRFSRDKSPYHPYVSARFPVASGGPVAGYFHLQPGEVLAGGGLFHPEPAVLAAWRQLVATDTAGVRATLATPAFTERFGQLNGERLRRVPAGFPADHPAADLLTMKDLVFGRPLSDADVASPTLPDLLADMYAAAEPVLQMLARAAPGAAEA